MLRYLAVVWVVALLLAAAALLVKPPERFEGEALLYAPLAGWNEAEKRSVNRVTLERPGAERVVFLKDTDGYWMMTEPYTFLAEQIKVHRLLSAAMTPKSDRLLPLTEEYRRAAETVAARLRLESGPRKIAAEFFRLPTHPHYYFIRYAEKPDQVLKVPDESEPELFLPAGDYRSRQLFPFPLDIVKEIHYMAGGREARITKQDGRFNAPGLWLETWREIEKLWNVAACAGYREAAPGGELLAAYEFTFLAGTRARCELHKEPGGAALLVWTGRKEGQLVDEPTRARYFPKVEGLVVPATP